MQSPRRLGAAMADDEWYWLQAGESRGPVATGELENLYHRKEVARETLVWRLGQDRWKPIAEILPNIDKLPPPLPSVPGETQLNSKQTLRAEERLVLSPANPQSNQRWSDMSPHPWRRYFARVFDTVVNGSITFFI